MEENKLKFQLSKEQLLRLVEKECEIEGDYSVEIGPNFLEEK